MLSGEPSFTTDHNLSLLAVTNSCKTLDTVFDSVFLALFVQGADCLDIPILGKHTKRLPQPMPLSNVAVVEVSCTIMSSYWRNGDCTKIAIRHGLKGGKNYDFACGIDLFQAFRSQALFAYPHELEPYCVIMSPPCIAMRCLKQLHNTWQAAMNVGCLSQHKPQVALEPNDTRHTSSVRTRGHHICGSSRKTLDARLFIAPMHTRPS